MSDLELRPSVKRFAEMMEVKLRLNDKKGGWSECNPDWLLARAMGEIGEMLKVNAEGGDRLEEAADAANFLMMYVEVKGGLVHA